MFGEFDGACILDEGFTVTEGDGVMLVSKISVFTNRSYLPHLRWLNLSERKRHHLF